MSEINANIIVQPNTTNISVNNNTIDFTPSEIQLRLYNTGREGPQGYTGSQGPPNGYTGSRGIGYVGSQGLQGPQCPPNGYTGSQGIQGNLGYIGSQGSGYIGSQGINGVIGYNGSQGSQGIQGYVGSQGIVGYIGSKGDLGYVGSQGIQGYTGSQGIIGYTGSKGDLGYTGSKGDLGYTGSIGIGYTGSAGYYIQNGTSSINIPSPNGNAIVTINGVSNTVVFSSSTTIIGDISLGSFHEKLYNGGNVSGTIVPNVNSATIYKYTLTGDITLNTINNAVTGTSMTIMFTQDATGNRALSSSMKFSKGLRFLSSAGSSTDIMFVFYDGINYYATLSTGYA